MIKLSAPDGHVIHCGLWQPDSGARGILQIFHGLGEHHERYARFAQMAAAQGLTVVAHDHRGHGNHAETPGHFSAADGWQHLIDDALLVNDMVRERFPTVPLVLLGHSMGSYIAQNFTMQHSDRVAALLLSASSWPRNSQLLAGRMIARLESIRVGTQGKSSLLDKLGFGTFNKRFEPARTPMDWLSRDTHEVDAYVNDPLCGGPYSCGLWLALLGGLSSIASDSALQRIRPDLPILLTSGSDDPVGGKHGLTRLAMRYVQTGHNQTTLKLYPGGRHEMLNETNRDEFSADLLRWINRQLPRVTGV